MFSMRYYLSIFLRRMPWFLLVAGLISGTAITVAMTLPPAYVSQVRLLVEEAQIPNQLAAPTVQMQPQIQLQLFETRLLTRANLLDIAQRLDVLNNQEGMNPDQIVSAMRSRTSIRIEGGRDAPPLMTISFEAPVAQTAAEVLNEYLTLILQEDSQIRTGRASQTQEFFEQETQRLSDEIDTLSARILEFKKANEDALPESVEFRRTQQISLQERRAQIERDISALRDQRERVVKVFDTTGQVQGGSSPQSPEETRLAELRRELSSALSIYSESNPRVRMLQAQVENAESAVMAATDEADLSAGADPAQSLLELQLAEIDSRITSLSEQRDTIDQQLAELSDSISRTPTNAVALDALERNYQNVQEQYNAAVTRLAAANTGERIELLSRGQRATVVEQPAVPSQPTRPNRLMLAGGGVGLGIALGLAVVALFEFLNGTARRPVDIVKRLGVTPLATIPYLRTRREVLWRRVSLLSMILAVAFAIPAAIYVVHEYYLPLDLLAERIMNKLGIRG